MDRGHPGQQVYTKYTKGIPYGVDHARPGSFSLTTTSYTQHAAAHARLVYVWSFLRLKHTEHSTIAIDTIMTKKQTYADN